MDAPKKNSSNPVPTPSKKSLDKTEQAKLAAGSQNNSEQANEEQEGWIDGRTKKYLLFQAVPSWFVSMIVHGIIILVLMLYALPEPRKVLVEMFSPTDEIGPVEEVQEVDIQKVDIDTVTETSSAPSAEAPSITPNEDMPVMSEIAPTVDVMDIAEFEEPSIPNIASTGGTGSNGLSGIRSDLSRAQMVKSSGGTDASENAVSKALVWLAAHQLPDGSWNFDHTLGPGGHRNSPNPGNAALARNGATAMALLPFLGAGQTHLKGNYKQVVEAGLNFLINNQKPKAGGGTFEEPDGSLYSHGLASIVLCEAYAMENDTRLLTPAQAAVNYIVYAQDPVGGGWRYEARQPGDTSVVGWQLMALKSAHLGFLSVPQETVRKAINYLDSVSAESGAFYGYTNPGNGRATTAIGLLCRMYQGWEKNHPSLERGVKYLIDEGPDTTTSADMYYNYYATQVVRHYLDSEFKESKWNVSMRDFLVKTQETKGNKAGSWYFSHEWAKRGGRLYCTAMAAMVLEVYYRHMPIYGKTAAEEEFPLE